MEANSGRRADAIVVGAGPAGSVTALLLARAGADVLLLDRAAFPRAKPCGDCLSAAATGLLDRIGLLDRVRAAGASELDHWEIVAPNGTVAHGRFHGVHALALERRRLDPVLLSAAREAGARFLLGQVTDLRYGPDGRVTGVRVRRGDAFHDLEARLVVGADGLRSVVARRLELIRRPPRLRKVSLTTHLPAPDPGLRHGEMHLIPDGCIGYAPAGGATRNLTVVVSVAAAGALRELGPGRFVRRQVERAPSLAARLEPVLQELERLQPDEILASGPFDWPTRASVARGAALVGDAAGYYDPFTGQGVYQAMAAAERLVRAVGPVLTGGGGASDLDAALQRYDAAKRRLTRPARRVQRLVEWVLSRPPVADRALDLLARSPRAMDRLVEVTGDLRAPRSLLSPAVVSSLLVPRPGGARDPHR